MYYINECCLLWLNLFYTLLWAFQINYVITYSYPAYSCQRTLICLKSIWTHHAGALISDFSASRIVQEKILLFKLPGLRYFVIAAEADESSLPECNKDGGYWTALTWRIEGDTESGNREDPCTRGEHDPYVNGTADFSPMPLFANNTKKQQKPFWYTILSC